ncbi:MAG TPA: methionyl-tRNA formyltransferase [Fredinandcohnia sp.]|nr:methionyl-tRNA formyltransferase [Fredinandcohnia sp.]
MKPRSVFFGTPEFAVPIAQATYEVTDLQAVVTQPDRPRGRGRELQPPPVKVWAAEHGLPVYQPTKLRDGTLRETLAAHRPDVAVVAAYGRILPKDILELPARGCLNVHASILPKYRGAAPIQWAIAEGETKTGVTLMQMDEGLDTGDVLAVLEIPIGPEDTGGTMHDKLAALGAELVRTYLPLFLEGKLTPQKQDDARATLAPILQKEDGRLDFRMPAEVLERRVRGFSPWPGAFTYLRGDGEGLLKIHRARAQAGTASARPGTVLSLQPLLVAAGEGSALEILEAQPEGRRRMTAEELRAGRWLQEGALLDPDRHA